MGDFPSSHTTATAPPTATAADSRRIYVNTSYLRSIHGILKAAQMVTLLIAFICVMATGFPYNLTHDANFLSFVTMGGFWTSAVLLFLNLINVVAYLSMLHWVLMELIYTGLWMFFCLVGGIVSAVFASKIPSGPSAAFSIAAFILFIALCVYGYNAFILFTLYKQGVRLYVVTAEEAPPSTTPAPTAAATQKY